MKFDVTIRTDSLVICDRKIVEAKSSMEAVLQELHHSTSAYQHMRDLPFARLSIGCHEVASFPPHISAGVQLTLSQEGSGRR